MYQTTSQNHFPKLFKSLTKNDSRLSRSSKYLLKIKKNHTNTLFKFEHPVYISSETGQALLILTDNPKDPHSFKFCVLTGSVQIASNVYFNTITLTPDCTIYLQAHEKDEVQTIHIKQKLGTTRYEYQFKINDIYSVSETFLTSNQSLDREREGYFELYITTQGDITYHVGTNSIKTHPNQALLFYPNQSGRIENNIKETSKYISISFNMEGLEHQLSQLAIILNNYDLQLFKDMINLSQQINHHKEPYDGDKFRTLLNSLLLRILRQEADNQLNFSNSMKSNYETELFQKMVTYLNEDIESRNEVQMLVDKFNLSRSTIQNLFTKFANCSPKTYINQVRLNKSKELMKDSTLSISQIAERLGYGSIQYFSRAFSREFGISPSNYAKRIIK